MPYEDPAATRIWDALRRAGLPGAEDFEVKGPWRRRSLLRGYWVTWGVDEEQGPDGFPIARQKRGFLAEDGFVYTRAAAGAAYEAQVLVFPGGTTFYGSLHLDLEALRSHLPN